jgi:delta24(24(1))-sterol reductase
LTASAAAKQYATYGTVSTPMIFMLVAHGLYTNACMKGEECIPTTWDIFYEKWGWMLIFWNLAGVPFVYCFNAMYLAQRPPFEHSTAYTIFCFSLLLVAYYVWDTSQSQRNRFRMQVRGTYVNRLSPTALGNTEKPKIPANEKR